MIQVCLLGVLVTAERPKVYETCAIDPILTALRIRSASVLP